MAMEEKREGKTAAKKEESRSELQLTFTRELPGLAGNRRFSLQIIEGNPLFYYLQSLDEQEVGLILVDPFPCFPDYNLELSPTDEKELQLEKKEDVLVLTTVTISGESSMTTNLAAPIIINFRQKLARQVIISDRIGQMHTLLPLGSVE